MELSLEIGVSVLICTYNGERLLPKTVEYLRKQKCRSGIPWEVIIINNASTDGTSSTMETMADTLRDIVPVHLFFEAKRGKENAVDKGLKVSTYKYVLICDDDNWLSDDYVEKAFDIMNSDPSIGLLGGKGIAAIDGTIPHWFHSYKSYYAVGDQYYLDGEIRHFWPKYRFIWGAGSVINKSAYKLLLASGFQRILTYKATGKISRSEDLELCFAIWLTGYKLWYNSSLTYQHYISQDRLANKKLLEIIKISIPATHYLKPYNIIKFTGPAFYPKGGFWYKQVVENFRVMIRKSNWTYDLKVVIKCMLGRIAITPFYTNKLIQAMQFYTSLRLGSRYELNFRRVCRLKENIDLQRLRENIG